MNNITWGNNMFVVVGTLGRMARSTNGTSWTVIYEGSGATASTFANNEAIYGITWGNGMFVAVGANGRAAISNNGTNWIPVTNTSFTGIIRNIAWNGTRFVAVGDGGRMAYWEP
jgi:hypothetical protein